MEKEIKIACTAVQICAALTKRLQRETLSADSSVSKSDYSPVTIADYAVQALLTSALHDMFSDDEFLAEESADELRMNGPLLDKVWELIEATSPAFSNADPPLKAPESAAHILDLVDMGGKNTRSNARRTWVFDPIDGTQTFLRGQQYCINVALLEEGIEKLGIIGCPNIPLDSPTVSEDEIDKHGLGLMVHAVRGQGAYYRPMQTDPALAPATRIERHGEHTTMEQLIWSDCSTYTSTITHLHQQVAAKLGTAWPGVDLYSSVLKYASLGLGRSSICTRIFKFASWRSNIWDHAGGVLIATEAGCKVTDLDGKSIDFRIGRKMAESELTMGSCAHRAVFTTGF